MIEIPFTDEELSTIYQSLLLHDEKKRLDVIELQNIVDMLRDGKEVPLFAEGESGALAAEGLIDWHRSDRVRINKILDTIESYRFGDYQNNE